VNLSQLEELERRLLCEIDFDKDSLRLYRLSGKNVYEVKEYGHFRAQDFDDPLVL
jgi:CRISPR-associated protein Cas2